MDDREAASLPETRLPVVSVPVRWSCLLQNDQLHRLRLPFGPWSLQQSSLGILNLLNSPRNKAHYRESGTYYRKNTEGCLFQNVVKVDWRGWLLQEQGELKDVINTQKVANPPGSSDNPQQFPIVP